ncbi:MAG: lipocalin-like domain-containing protein [Chloroflexota bacterium]
MSSSGVYQTITFPVEDDLSGYSFATEEGFVQFPDSLGAHPDFQTEWWYYTGNLESDDGRQFGYQFTIFRRAIDSPANFDKGDTESWRTNQIYFAHVAIADIENNDFFHDSRFARGAAGLAGAKASPYEVWIENWEVKEISPGVHEMKAKHVDFEFDLVLRETQPPVLHGIDGLSPKSEGVGKASYYYSLVDMETTGEVVVNGEKIQVKGKSWKDHEVATNPLADNAIGWDWFSAQLDTGESLMFGNIRLEDNTLDPYSGGSWILPDSSIEVIRSNQDVFVEVVDTWTSPGTGATYPSEWIIRIPEKNLELNVTTLVDDAELLAGFTVYWEGPAYYEGTMNGESISGYGYIELTGYVDPIEL